MGCENEKAMIRDMAVSAGEMIEASGAKNVRTFAHLDPSPNCDFKFFPTGPTLHLHHAEAQAKIARTPGRATISKVTNCDLRDLGSIPADRLIESLGWNAVRLRQSFIQHHALAADVDDLRLEV